MSIRLFTLAFLFICMVVSSFAATTQIPKMKAVPYEAWGIQVDVPQTATRANLVAKDDIELWDLHLYGDFVYFVQVMKVPPSTLTSTAIEQDIQAQSNLQSKRGATKRWEMDSRQRELFKGLNYFMKPDEDLPEAAVELQKVLRGRTAYVSAAWAPLKDDAGPMMVVGVIGPKGRDDEVDNLAKFFARGVTKLHAEPTTPVHEAPSAFVKPTVPRVVQPARHLPELKKGDIEIIGVIKSVTKDRKCITVNAEQIVMPGSAPVKLQPVRQKTVRVNKLPEEMKAGSRVLVIGKNTGVGKPMTADFIDKAP